MSGGERQVVAADIDLPQASGRTRCAQVDLGRARVGDVIVPCVVRSDGRDRLHRHPVGELIAPHADEDGVALDANLDVVAAQVCELFAHRAGRIADAEGASVAAAGSGHRRRDQAIEGELLVGAPPVRLLALRRARVDRDGDAKRVRIQPAEHADAKPQHAGRLVVAIRELRGIGQRRLPSVALRIDRDNGPHARSGSGTGRSGQQRRRQQHHAECHSCHAAMVGTHIEAIHRHSANRQNRSAGGHQPAG